MNNNNVIKMKTLLDEFFDLLEYTNENEGYSASSLYNVYAAWLRINKNIAYSYTVDSFIRKVQKRFTNIINSGARETFFKIKLSDKILENETIKYVSELNVERYELEEDVDLKYIIRKVLTVNDFDKFILESCTNYDDNGYSMNSLYIMFLYWAKTNVKNDRTISYSMFVKTIVPYSKYLPTAYNRSNGGIIYPLKCSYDNILDESRKIDLSKSKKEESSMMNKSLAEKYNNSDRKFEPGVHSSIDTITAFIEKRQYSRRFGKESWVRFADVFEDYLKFCDESIYVPVSRTFFKAYLEDLTYQIEKIWGGKYLYINFGPKNGLYPGNKPVPPHEEVNPNSKVIELPLDPIPFNKDLELSVTVQKEEEDENKEETNIVPKPQISEEDLLRIDKFVRDKFVNKYCHYATYNTYNVKKLYASFKYYTKNDSISYDEFAYVISSIPLAKVNIPKYGFEAGKLFSCLIPEFSYLKFMKHKSNFNIANYKEKVTDAEKETLAIYANMNEDTKEETKKEEIKIVPETKAVEETKPKEKEVHEEVKKEINTSNPSINLVENEMKKIEEKYKAVLIRYKTLDDIKHIIKARRDEVHPELHFVFDMAVKDMINAMDNITPEEMGKAKMVLESKLDSLASFVKK